MPLTFPIHLFQPSGIKPDLAGRVITGADSISGVGQTVRTDGGGYWRCSYSGISLISSDQIRAWRAWQDYANGGAVQFLVPVADIRHAPRGMAGGALIRPGPLLATGSDPYFPEALGYAAPVIVASAGAADLRATSLTITVSRGDRVKGGQYFSIDHETKGRRMYRTGRVLSQSGQTATVETSPPLREAIGASTPVDFDWPSFLGAVQTDIDTSPELLFARQGEVSISFREAF